MITTVDIEREYIDINFYVGKSRVSDIEIYLCIPAEADINDDTYDIDDFYKNKSSRYFYHITKVKAPLLSQTLRGTDPNVDLPVFVRAYNAHIKRLTREQEPKKNNIDKILKEIDELLSLLRALKVQKGVLKTYRDSDEICTFHTEQVLLKWIESHSKKYDMSSVVSFIEKQRYHRVKTYGNASNKDAVRRITYKENILTRFVELNKCIKQLGNIREQFAFSLSAFLSMFFTTAIVFYFQNGYGTLSINVFIILCVSYIFKDRFKELFRNYVLRKLGRGKFQKVIKLSDNTGRSIGSIYEMAELKPLPPNLKAIRSVGSKSKRINDETALYYKKRYVTKNDFINNFTHIRETISLNIDDILKRLPANSLAYSSLDGNNVITEHTNQIYDLNIIIVDNNKDIRRHRVKIANGQIRSLSRVALPNMVKNINKILR
ncbi:hypothetical protein [Thaumasiovibrio sp. DFM-14]|uniref:hypothetical protein n=1 Tax=Thaumasiovibrio sp. DFM-14 TaxID=3384792 RepID=UPI0039A2444F